MERTKRFLTRRPGDRQFTGGGPQNCLSWLVVALTFAAAPGQAQVTNISGSGLGTLVNGEAAVACAGGCAITGGTRPGGGPNLFHSFGDFSVGLTNGVPDVAQFLNRGSVDLNGTVLQDGLATTNILGRVTGGNLSSIYGTIDSAGEFPTANLFLINPAGFLFGSGTQVNVGGMAAFTSADYTRLEEMGGLNAGIFYADPAKASMLTSAPVVAFGFLGSNPGAFTVQGGQLSVADGTGISLVGGDITIQADPDTDAPASLLAPAGEIRLASAQSPGEFRISSLTTGPNIAPFNQSFSAMGAITIEGGATVDVSGSPGGAIRILGGQFVLDAASLTNKSFGDQSSGETTITAQSVTLANGASILSSSEEIGPGGPITVTASEMFEISGSDIDGFSSRIVSQTLGEGGGGNVTISSPLVTFDLGGAGANLATVGAGSGQAGDVAIIDAQTVDLLGASGIQSANFGPLPGGRLQVSTNSITIADGSYIESLNSGDGGGGSISVSASDSVSVLGADINGTPSRILTKTDSIGQAGELTVQAMRNITVADGGAIQSESAGPDGASGIITIIAQDTMTVTGSFDPNTPSLISNRSLDFGAANGGITIQSGRFLLTDSAQLLTETFDQGGGTISVAATESAQISGGSRITTESTRADTGSVEITAGFITLDQDGRVNTRSVGLGDAGSITLTATAGSLTLSGGSRVRSSTDQSSGQGGTIVATASDSVLMSGGSALISSSARSGLAGPITVTADNVVSLSGTGTGLFSEALRTGNGGPISINATTVALNGATVSASVKDVPIGGNPAAGTGDITLTSSTLNMTGGMITAETSGTRNAGTITLNTGTANMSGNAILSSASTGTATGDAGSVTLQGMASPADVVTLTNSTISTNAANTGQGGSITVDGSNLTLNNATVSASVNNFNSSPGSTDSATVGLGNIALMSPTLSMTGGSIKSETTGSRNGGTITVNAIVQDGAIMPTAAQSATLNNGASISATSTGPANAGDIVINAGQNYTSTNSSVTTQATAPGTEASGGNITVLATDMVQLTNSQINASVQGSTMTKGGTIVIDPQFVILNNSQILAQATQGQGGTINIFFTGAYLPDATSIVSASSQTGINGNVNIQSPISQAGGKIVPMSNKPVETTALLSQRCVAAAASGEYSSFVVAGRDTLPTEPGGWLTSQLATLSAGEGPVARGEGLEGNALTPTLSRVPAAAGAGERENFVSVRRLPPGSGVAMFSTDGAAGCGS